MSLKILIAYSMSSSHVQTTLDYLLALKRYGGFDVSYIHVTHSAVMNFDIEDYDVVFHNYCGRLCFEGYVSQSYREAMKQFRGLKVLAVQDEYNRTNVLKAAIRDLGFHVVLTCVPQDSIDYVYPRSEFPDVEFITVLTGYVPDELVATPRAVVPLAQRPIAVGYRGRDLGGFYGRLAFEKYEIGRRMREICLSRGIPHDIAMDEDSRIYGPAWFDFIGACRTMLGSESGSNVFDFDGSIERTYNEMAASRSGNVSYKEFLPIVAQRESEISMGQISPRVFECAAMRTPMVLFRGRYSGVIAAGDHYIALEKDFSNVNDVLVRLEDIRSLEAMAERTYEDIIASGCFGYRAHVRRLAVIIERKIDELGLHPRSVSPTLKKKFQDVGDSILNQAPTEHPLGATHFEVSQTRQLVAVLEPEIERLSNAFDRASEAYCTEAVRLNEVTMKEMARITGTAGSAIEKPFGETNLIDVAQGRLTDFVGQCRARHGEARAMKAELAAKFAAFARHQALSAEVQQDQLILDNCRTYIRWIQNEIGTLNSEIEELNKVGIEAVKVTHDAAINTLRYMLRATEVPTSLKLKIALRGCFAILIASASPWAKKIILKLPFSKRMIGFLRSRSSIR